MGICKGCMKNYTGDRLGCMENYSQRKNYLVEVIRIFVIKCGIKIPTVPSRAIADSVLSVCECASVCEGLLLDLSTNSRTKSRVSGRYLMEEVCSYVEQIACIASPAFSKKEYMETLLACST